MTNCLRNAHPDHTVRLSPLQIIATRPLLACVALHWVTGAKLCSIWDAILLDRAVGICEIRSRRVPRSRRNVTKRTFLPGRIVLLLTIVSPFERSTLCFLCCTVCPSFSRAFGYRFSITRNCENNGGETRETEKNDR